MAFDTFDTDSVATSGITFTGSNLIATATAGSLANSRVAQAVEGKTSGKWYVEFTCGGVSGNVDGVGVICSTGVGAMGFIGNSDTAGDCGWGYYTNNHVAHNNVTQTSVNNTTWGNGDVIGLAIDIGNKTVWWNKNGGSWVGTSGTPNPATNTGGFDISNLVGMGRIYPACNLSGSGAKFTANFGASAFTGTVPSGFNSGWTNTTSGTYFGTFATNGWGQNTSAPPLSDVSVSKYVSTLTGTLDRVVTNYSQPNSDTVKCVVYNNTGTGGLPGALLGTSAALSLGATAGEQTFTTFSPSVSLTSGNTYYFGFISSAAISTPNVECPGTSAAQIWFAAGTYASPPSTFPASPSTVNFRYPMLIYTAAAVNYTLTSAQGSYALTGKAALFETGKRLTAAQGSYTLTGKTAAFIKHISIPSAQGSYSLSGKAVVLDRTRSLLATTGFYHINGQDVLGGRALFLRAHKGHYRVHKQKTILRAAGNAEIIWPVDTGDYVLTGEDVVFGKEKFRLTFADLTSTTYQDWPTLGGADFESYLNTAYVVPQDMMTWTQVPYLYVFVDDTDTAADVGLLLNVVRNWAETGNVPQTGDPIEVYRHRNGYLLSVTKNRIRGRGRVMQLQFRSETGKAFNLRGWAMWLEKNGTV